MTPRYHLRWEAILPPAFFLALTGLVAFPWFREPGLLFLLDFVWPPQLHPPTELWKTGLIMSLPHEWLWWALGTVIPTATVQKLAFALPFFLSGLSAFHLVRWMLRAGDGSTPVLAALVTGTFYALNPFVVTRALMGQLYFLLGYALTPWALLATLSFLRTPSPRTGARAGVAIAGTVLGSGHHLVLLALLLLPFLKSLRRAHVQPRVLVGLALPLLITTLATVLVWTRADPDQHALVFHPLGPWARALQAPFSGNLLVDSLTLTATWKTNLPFAFSFELLSGFAFVTAALLVVMGMGLIASWNHHAWGWMVRGLLVVLGVSTVFAIGVAHPLTEPFAAWAYREIPFWLAMRDSAKFLSLVALTESVLLGLGIAAYVTTARQIGPSAARTLAAATLLLTLYYVSGVFQGFGGQLTPADYPRSWSEWNRRLATLGGRPRMLFLPWHQYLPFAFTENRTVTNPSPRFFTNAAVLSGDNSEVGGNLRRPFIYSESHRPLSKRLEEILKDAPARVDIGSRIALEGIRYVALATDSIDSTSYDYLSQQADLHPVFESPELTVWEVGPHS